MMAHVLVGQHVLVERHVLVAHADHGIRDVVAQALHEEAEYSVVSAPDAALALSTLWLASSPMVALIDDHLSPRGGLGLLALAANDEAGGPLSRHRFIVMSTFPQTIREKGARVLSRLGARILSQPFDLDALLLMVDAAASSPARDPSLSPPRPDEMAVANRQASLVRASWRAPAWR